MYVDELMNINYGSSNLQDINVWGYKYKDIPAYQISVIQSVNIRYPILLYTNLRLLDGHHRLLYCKLHNISKIRTTILPYRILTRGLISDWATEAEYSKNFTYNGKLPQIKTQVQYTDYNLYRDQIHSNYNRYIVGYDCRFNNISKLTYVV